MQRYNAKTKMRNNLANLIKVYYKRIGNSDLENNLFFSGELLIRRQHDVSTLSRSIMHGILSSQYIMLVISNLILMSFLTPSHFFQRGRDIVL